MSKQSDGFITIRSTVTKTFVRNITFLQLEHIQFMDEQLSVILFKNRTRRRYCDCRIYRMVIVEIESYELDLKSGLCRKYFEWNLTLKLDLFRVAVTLG